jgi:hypothetical protein
VDATLAPNAGAGADDETGAFAPNDGTEVGVTPPKGEAETGAAEALSAAKVFWSPALVSFEKEFADDEDVPNLSGCDEGAETPCAAAPAAVVVGVVLMPPPVAAGVAPTVAEPPKSSAIPAPASFDVRDKTAPSGLVAVPAKDPNGGGLAKAVVVAAAPRLLLDLPAGFWAPDALSLLDADAVCPRRSAGVGAEKENCGNDLRR